MKFIKIIALFSLFVTAGCFQQKPDKVSKKSSYGSKFEVQKSKCNNVDFHHDFFRHQNLMSVFECLGWDKEYPLFTGFMQEQKQGFDEFALDFNKKYFRSKKSRAEFYQLLKKINNNKFIDDSHELLELMTKDERAKIFAQMLASSRNPEWAINDFFLPVLKFFFTAKMNVQDNTQLLDHAELFKSAKVKKAMEAISSELLATITDPVLRNQLLRFTYEPEKNWPISYVHALEGDDIVAMNSIFFKNYKQLSSQIDTVANFVTRPSKCQVAGRWIEIDHAQEMYDSTKKFVGAAPKTMMWDLAELMQKFAIYENICENTASQKRYIKATQGVLGKIVDSIFLKGSIEFMTRLIEIKLTKKPLSSMDFLKFFSSPFFKNYQIVAQELQQKGHSVIFADILDVLKRLHPQDFAQMHSIVKSLGEELQQDKNLRKFMQKNHQFLLLEFFSDLMINSMDFGGRSREFLELMNFMPDTAEDRKYLASFMSGLILKLQRPEFVNEMQKFMGRKSLFQFTGLMGTSKEVKTKVAAPVKISNAYSLAYNLLDPTCVSAIKNSKVIDFDSLVKTGIFKCAPQKSNYYFYHVYEWTAQLDKYFQQQHGHKFSLRYGIVSPEMMGLYLSLVMIAKEHLYRPDGLYVRDAINNVRSALYDKSFMSLLNESLATLQLADKKLKLMDKLSKVLESKIKSGNISNTQIREVLQLAISKTQPIPAMRPLCKELNPGISSLTCLNSLMVTTYFRDISRMLLENHQKDASMLDYLLDAFYDVGIQLPVLNKQTTRYKISFSEFIDFYNHLNAVSTKETIDYYTGKDVWFKAHLTMSERLEIVIRDINFNSNFYGIYFMNSGAQAKDYIEKMQAMKSKLGMLVNGGGVLRFFGVLDDESKHKFKNVESTYQSLIDVKGPYRNGYGQHHSYVKLIQALMGSAVKASPEGTTDFHPYRPPSFEKVTGHKGNLITRVAELSLITRIGKLLERMGSRVSLERSRSLDQLGENFKRRMPRSQVKDFLVHVLQHPHILEVVQDLYKLQEKMQPGEVVLLFKLITTVLEDSIAHSSRPVQVLELVKRLLDNYPVIKANFSRLPAITDLVNLAQMEKLMQHSWGRKLVIELTDELIKDIGQIVELLVDKQFTSQLVNNVILGKNTKLNFDTAVLKQIFLDPRVDWMTMVKNIADIRNSPEGIKYLEDLLLQMARKNASGQSGFEFALKTIFSEPKALELFLEDAFRKVKFN